MRIVQDQIKEKMERKLLFFMFICKNKSVMAGSLARFFSFFIVKGVPESKKFKKFGLEYSASTQ